VLEKVKLASSKDKSSFLKAGFFSVLLRGSNAILQVLVSVILARLLGPEEFGGYTLVIITAGLIGLLSQFGMPGAIVRQISVHFDVKDYARCKGLVLSSFRIITIFSACLILVTMIVNHFLAVSTINFFYVVVLVLPFSLLILLGSTARGFGMVILGQIPDSIIKPILILIGLGLTFLATDRLRVADVVAINLVTTTIALMVLCAVLAKRLPRDLLHAEAECSYRSWVTTSLPFLMLALVQYLNNQIDIIMLGTMTNSGEVGVYRVGLILNEAVNLPLAAVGIVLAPNIARLFSKQEFVVLRDVMVRAHRYSFCLLVPIIIFIIFLSRIIISVSAA